jgi:hypothetical protein
MFGAATLIDIEKLGVLEDGCEVGVAGTKLMECEGKVYDLCLGLVNEFTLSREGRTFLVRSEH